MLGSEMLDVAIALVLVYLLLSAMSSAVRDVIAYLFDHRADQLEAGVRFLLREEATRLATALYDHPLIADVPESRRAASRRPAHIPPRSFALALMDILSRKADGASATPAPLTAGTAPPEAAGTVPPEAAGPAPGAPPAQHPPLTFASVRAGAAAIENEAVRRAVLTALDSAQGDFDRARANLETWFDTAMGRLSSWYRRQSQRIVMAVSIVLTLGLNVNTLAIINQLSKDDALRAQIVQQAVAVTAPTPGSTDVRASYAAIEALGLPLGWGGGWPGAQVGLRPESDRFRWWEDVTQPIAGWLITIFAVSLGAPFWFSLLSRAVSLRTSLAGAPRDEAARGSAGT